MHGHAKSGSSSGMYVSLYKHYTLTEYSGIPESACEAMIWLHSLLYLRVCGYFINQILCEVGGIGVQNAHPLQPI